MATHADPSVRKTLHVSQIYSEAQWGLHSGSLACGDLMQLGRHSFYHYTLTPNLSPSQLHWWAYNATIPYTWFTSSLYFGEGLHHWYWSYWNCVCIWYIPQWDQYISAGIYWIKIIQKGSTPPCQTTEDWHSRPWETYVPHTHTYMEESHRVNQAFVQFSSLALFGCQCWQFPWS